jgi:transcriptional regulator with XRE-family HTH domain
LTLDPDELGQNRNSLAATLRALRRHAGLTGDQLARRCAMSQSKISKIETGRLLPSVVDVERILRVLAPPAELAAEVTALARLAGTEFQDVRSILRKGLAKKQDELASLEASATELRYFLPAMITALLATPEYIRASFAHSPADISQAVARKLERQAVLEEKSKRLSFVLSEAAIRWVVCPPAIMAAQLERLVAVSQLPAVRVGVIPFGVQIARGPLNTFTVYDDRLATAETFTGILVFRDPRDVAFYRQLFAMYEDHALFGDEARANLLTWARAFR